MKTHTRPVYFLLPFLAVYGALVALIGFDLFVLWRAGELQSLDAVTRHEYRAATLYNAMSIGFADYKYAAYRAPTPDIVAIGTSRALRIREGFFLKPFYNLGGLANGPEQANTLASRLLLRGKHPRVVIFTLDYWTFCRPPHLRGPDRLDDPPAHDGMGQPDPYFLVYRLLADGRYSIGDFANLLFSSPGERRIGISARIGRSGFAADGSLYGLEPTGPLESRWVEVKQRIADGTGQFGKDCKVSAAALSALARFVARMDAAGMATVLIMAPLPAVTIDLMRADRRYDYIEDLRKSLSQAYPQRFFDFLDMRETSSDSEFLDGFHGGEITYMRIILAAARPQTSPLHGLVDIAELEKRIQAGTGQVSDAHNPVYRELVAQ